MAQCQVEGCENEVRTRGWCQKHYSRWVRHGDPNVVLERRRAELRVPEGLRRCARCKQVKPVEDFSGTNPNRRTKDSKSVYCRPCEAERQREWRVTHPGYSTKYSKPKTAEQKRIRWEREIEKRYGMSVASFDELLEAQTGVCAICSGPPNGQGSRLQVDHDHDTSRVRGLLCSKCNTLLGLADHKTERLMAAALYLKE